MCEKKIEEVLAEYTGELMSLPGVVGTGLGLCEGTPCIKVFVVDLASEAKKKIPEQLEGYTVKIEQTDPFTARR